MPQSEEPEAIEAPVVIVEVPNPDGGSLFYPQGIDVTGERDASAILNATLEHLARTRERG